MIMQEWWLASVIHSMIWMRCVRATVICTHRRDIISQDHRPAHAETGCAIMAQVGAATTVGLITIQSW
jgi:hypothetical protein